MTNYHTLNITKKYYQRIQEYAEAETIFGNTKAYILHCVANDMMNENQTDLGMEALRKLQEDEDIDSSKIKKALSSVAQEKLEK